MINLTKFKKTKEPSELESELTRLFEKLKTYPPNSPEYDKVSDQIAKLYKLKEVDSKKRVSPDTLVGALTNLAGIVMIVHHEELNVITSKALALVGKSIKS